MIDFGETRVLLNLSGSDFEAIVEKVKSINQFIKIELINRQ